MTDWAVALLSVGGSAVFAFLGSYVASKQATHKAEQERQGEK